MHVSAVRGGAEVAAGTAGSPGTAENPAHHNARRLRKEAVGDGEQQVVCFIVAIF
jgi:hypothetical protein